MSEEPGTVTVPVSAIRELSQLNADAVKAVSQVVGNSVQDNYRNQTLAVLKSQQDVLAALNPDPEGDYS